MRKLLKEKRYNLYFVVGNTGIELILFLFYHLTWKLKTFIVI